METRLILGVEVKKCDCTVAGPLGGRRERSTLATTARCSTGVRPTITRRETSTKPSYPSPGVAWSVGGEWVVEKDAQGGGVGGKWVVEKDAQGGGGGGGGEVKRLFGCDFADQLQMRRNSSADIAPGASHDHREALLTSWILEIFL